MTASRFMIYGLMDPRTLLIRYVGRSSSGFQHPRTYKNPSSLKDSTRRCRWIKELLSVGLIYEIVLLEELGSSEHLNAAEKWWIAYGRLSDWPLVNLTDGGEGLSGYKLTAETKAKISAANKGRIPTDASREANARAQRGRKHSDETRRKISASATVRQAAPELREHMRRTSTGYKHTAKTKAKMRKPRNRPHPPLSPAACEQRSAFALTRRRKQNGTFL